MADSPRSRPALRTLCALLVLALALPACGLKVKSIGPRPQGESRPPLAYGLRVGVEGSQGLTEYLRRNDVFEEVIHEPGNDPVDLRIVAETTGRYRPGGFANFATWIPGGLLLLPSFRGIRWTYDATARLEVTDVARGERLGTYKAESSTRLVHRASVPGSFFSTLVIVPALVRGIQNARVRQGYESKIYERAYRDLWHEIGVELMRDHATFERVAARVQEQRAATRRLASRAPPRQATRSRVAPAAPPPRARRRLAAGDFYSRRVAVVVGIDDYQRWPALGGARGDAKRMARHLREAGFDEVYEVYDGEATRKRLMAVLGTELSAAVDADSLAFIYFAGHGQTETLPGGAKRGYVIPVDGDVDDVFATGISMDTLRHLSARMTAKHVFYAIDACYSGLALTRGLSMRQTAGYLDKVTRIPAVQILTAGSEGEKAVEIGGQGLFTTYLLRALSGEADLDGDGAVTATEAGAWIKPQVTNASGARQTPQFGTIDGSGDVVFIPGS